MTQRFINMVIKAITNELGDGFTVESKEVIKNNDTTRCGIIIHEKGKNVSPTIYIDDIGGTTKEVAMKVIESYKSASANMDFADTSKIIDWDYARTHVVPRLINTKANTERLKGIISRQFLDLSIIYAVNVGTDASVTITSQLLNEYGVTEQELYNTSLENIMGNAKFDSMISVLMQFDVENETLDDGMYVLTNTQKMFGAVSILDATIMKNIRRAMNGDFYVIPSSVHEVICLRKETMPADALADMIRDVNATTLSPDEILSDHAYVYTESGLQIA